MWRDSSWTVALLICAGCGGTLQTGDGSDGGSEADAAHDAYDAGPVDEAGYTRCATPEGYGICGSATGCDGTRPGCGTCGFLDAGVGICGDVWNALAPNICPLCEDGEICMNAGRSAPASLICVPYSLGHLLSPFVGTLNLLRYADLGLWTDAPLPEAATCSTFSGFQVCGGTCGGCDPGWYCVGRSPLHPNGFCVDYLRSGECSLAGKNTCAYGGLGADGCFTYKVQPEAQAVADEHGVCVPMATCKALAVSLPGGGTCTAQ